MRRLKNRTPSHLKPLAELAAAISRGVATPRQPRATGREWVSKTDMTSYLRCPYAFWQVDRGALTQNDTFDEITVRLIEDGVGFHEAIVDELEVVSAVKPEMLMGEEFRLFGVPVIENQDLKLLGAPDGIIAAAGALVPIEAKSHRDVQRSDELELAFYWLLLAPYRAAPKADPRGVMILRRDGAPVEVEIEITENRLAEARRLIAEVRHAREHGVRPRMCGCPACRGPLHEEVLAATAEARDLTMIWQVKRARAQGLEALGIADYTDLASCDPTEIASLLCKVKLCVSAAEVLRWSHHATAYLECRPVRFGPLPQPGGRYIALDLEYNPFGPDIWLIGVHIAEGNRNEQHILWSDTPEEERANLIRLAELLAERPDLPVMTWAGSTADIPRLRGAVTRFKLDGLLDEMLTSRHMDLYRHAAGAVRLPIPTFELDAVAGYFGFAKLSDVRGGLEANILYGQYLAASSKRKRQIKDRLIAYNRDDLAALATVIATLAEL
jgi:predicted RecB family nuclease